MRCASRVASVVNACAAGDSGSVSTTGVPASEPSRTAVSRGIWVSSSTSVPVVVARFPATVAPPPLPKTSIRVHRPPSWTETECTTQRWTLPSGVDPVYTAVTRATPPTKHTSDWRTETPGAISGHSRLEASHRSRPSAASPAKRWSIPTKPSANSPSSSSHRRSSNADR